MKCQDSQSVASKRCVQIFTSLICNPSQVFACLFKFQAQRRKSFSTAKIYLVQWDLNIASVLSREHIHSVSFASPQIEGLIILSILPPCPPLASVFEGGKWMRQGKNLTDTRDREEKL